MKLGIALASLAIISTTALAGTQGKAHMMKPTMGMSKADWQKRYDAADKMFDKMDSKAIFEFMTPDFTMTMMGQKNDRTQAEAGLKNWFGMMKTLHCTMTVTKVGGDMKSQTVVAKFNNAGMTKPDPKTHKSGKLVDTGTETAVWVNMGGKWMMKSLSMTGEKMTMNGKPFKPNMGG